MAIYSIEPKTSKVTGGVIIDITGTNFLKSSFEFLPTVSTVIDTSTNLASLEDTNLGLKFNLPENIGQRASFEVDREFPEAFKVEVDFELTELSLPLVKNTILLGLEVIQTVNTSKKIRYYLSYSHIKGYQIILEEKFGTSVIYRKEEIIDISKIEKIGLHVCGKSVHGFVQIANKEIFLLSSEFFATDTYKLQVFSETPENGVPMNSEILIKKVTGKSAVSFSSTPTEIISLTNTSIKFKTMSGEISLGDLIVSSADFSMQKKVNEVRYVFGNGIANVRKQFDTIQAIYSQHVTPSREDLFKNQKGFQWDENYILDDNSKNRELSVPTLWDPTTGNIPKHFFQSGVGPYNALAIESIEKIVSNDVEAWYPRINHGTYYIQNTPYYLFSDQSIIEYLGETKTEDGRSKHNLLYRPKIGVPVSIFSMTEDKETRTTIQKKHLLKKGRFTGKVVNGVELDTINPANIDPSKEEFIVKVNNNNEIKNWIIPIPDQPSIGIYKFTLPKIPLQEFDTIFSRTDIFKTKKTKASKYGEALYGAFLFGEGVEQFGDYTVDYQTGEVEVSLEYLYKDLGVVSFTFDYPAVIEFNKDYTFDKGSKITNPSFVDLNTLDNLGSSNGRPFQEFRLNDFPVIDNSRHSSLDINNFKVFIYDEFDNSFDPEWSRVTNIKDARPEDKVYEINPANGILKFGNNTTGKIPGKYTRILAGYKPTMKIQFEPETSNDYWIAKTTDLNLTKQNLSAGFLYLNRKRLVPSQIIAEFSSKHINVFETTDISATVYTQEGEIIPNIKVSFEMVNGGGKFADQELVTNPNGYVSTVYTPSSRLEDMGIRVDLFKPSSEVRTRGESLENNYGTKGGIPYLSLKSTEVIQGNLNEIVLFKILDDGDNFLPYNNETRKGGRLVLHYKNSAPVRGEYLAGSIIGFSEQLPQPFDPYAPNYEPDLRGFYIVGKKTIQVRAYIDLEDGRVYSNIVSLTCEYSPIQTGTWTLPTPPLDYEHSQINTATYIDINV